MDTELRRRAYLIGLAIGLPTLPIIWIARQEHDLFLRVTYPGLAVFLLALLVGLWTRRLPVRTAERATFVGIGAFYLIRLAVAIHSTDDLADVTGELTASTFWNISLLFIFAYLAFETRRALRINMALYGAVLAILGSRLVPDALAGRHLDEAVTHLRVATFFAASIALLYGLAQAKDRLAEERHRAKELSELAYTDALTRLPNRRRLEDVLAERMADARRYERNFSVLLLDVDAFKLINDRYGHPVGDGVLRDVAAVLGPELRANDVLGRWGGEEFVLVAPETDAARATQLAERCREVLAAHGFDGIDHAVTVSIGVATYRPGDRVRDLVKRADDALYVAKRGGRNRVSVL